MGYGEDAFEARTKLAAFINRLLGWPAMASSIAQIRKSVLTLALPVTISTLLQRTEGIAAVFLVGGLGATSIAAVGLGQLLAFIATTLVSGLSVGANVLIAQLWGARRTKDVGEAATHLVGLAAIVSGSLMGLGLSLNRFIMELLGAEHDVIALALPYSNFIFLVIPCTIFLQVLSSIIQGTGDTKSPLFISIISQVVIPLGICFVLRETIGLEAWHIWMAILAGHTARCVLSIFRFAQGKWRSINVDIETTTG